MDRRRFSLSLFGAAALAGCGSALDTAAGTLPAKSRIQAAPSVVRTTSQLLFGTAFGQSIPAARGEAGIAPGQANWFDLDGDFSVDHGGHHQFDGALALSVQVGDSSEAFPSDQRCEELTALGPPLGVTDGVKLVSFSDDPAFRISGTRSAALHVGPDVRLQHKLQLGKARRNVELRYVARFYLGSNLLGEEWYFQVVVRDSAGTLLATLYRYGHDGEQGTSGRASLSAFRGRTVVLSFERSLGLGCVLIDDVSVEDAAGTEYVSNGGFEQRGAEWKVVEHPVSQNVRSGARTLNGLKVQRTFYTHPLALWGRMTDGFTNTGPNAVTAFIRYRTNLGSEGRGVIYPSEGCSGKALTAWDSGQGTDTTRDVGIVFGTAGSVDFRSASGTGGPDGSSHIDVTFKVSLLPGETATLVNFLLLSGAASGKQAADERIFATEVDAVAADIVGGFPGQAIFRRGMTRQQLHSLRNF